MTTKKLLYLGMLAAGIAVLLAVSADRLGGPYIRSYIRSALSEGGITGTQF